MFNARKRGVWFDVGYGTPNFDWDIFDKLLAQEFIVDVIDSDLQSGAVTGPAHSLGHIMSIFLNHGLSLAEVIQRVTINPARLMQVDEHMGSLTPGYGARLTLFEVNDGDFTFRDSRGVKRQGEKQISANITIMDGEVIECDPAPALEQSNWSFMLLTDDDLSISAGKLDAEQREFAHALARDCADLNWKDGYDIHCCFKRRVATTGIDQLHASNALIDLFMEHRFCVPVGWLLKTFDRDIVVNRLRAA